MQRSTTLGEPSASETAAWIAVQTAQQDIETALRRIMAQAEATNHWHNDDMQFVACELSDAVASYCGGFSKGNRRSVQDLRMKFHSAFKTFGIKPEAFDDASG
jgi:hypothetical protein